MIVHARTTAIRFAAGAASFVCAAIAVTVFVITAASALPV